MYFYLHVTVSNTLNELLIVTLDPIEIELSLKLDIVDSILVVVKIKFKIGVM